MKILLLNGSPHHKNTFAMCEAFKEGAEKAGHVAEIIDIGTMTINGCRDCGFCHGKGSGQCAQKDDMQEVYPKLAEADMVVIASPIYYWGFTGQIQSLITRFYAPGKPAAKKYALLLSSGSPNVYDAPVSQYKGFVNYFGAENVGIITAHGDENGAEETLSKIKEFAAKL